MKKWIVKLFPEAHFIRVTAVRPDGRSHQMSFSQDDLVSEAVKEDCMHSGVLPILTRLRLIMDLPRDADLPAMEFHIGNRERSADKLSVPTLLLHSGNTSFSGVQAPLLGVEVPEETDKEGIIRKGLDESSMNGILREVYKYPGASVIIALQNSRHNSLHERNLNNLLKAAGYKELFLSHRPGHLLFLACYYPDLREYLKETMDDLLSCFRNELDREFDVFLDF